jgi:streptogramin lyase
MKTKIQFSFLALIIIFLVTISLQSCDIFVNDGNNQSSIVRGGYFYLLDKESNAIVMLDPQLKELKRWDLKPLTPSNNSQGITFDGSYLWISISTDQKKILKLDASGDSLIVLTSFNAPPNQGGTIRGITWDGAYLWAINSGSTTSPGIRPKLYKLDTKGVIQNGTDGWELPTAEDPRGLAWVPSITYTYGYGPDSGIYYTDITLDKIFHVNMRSIVDTGVATPVPPRGTSYNSAVGLTFDGKSFWLTNSSASAVAEHLYRITMSQGKAKIEDRFDLPYSQVGAIVWTNADVRKAPPPIIYSIAPYAEMPKAILDITINGANFKNNLTVNYGSGIVVNSLQFVSQELIKTNITIDSNAVLGKRDVTITNPDGQSFVGASLFEVVESIPHLWIVDNNMDTLYQLRATDTTVVKRWDTKTVAPHQTAQGLAYDGNNIWLCTGSSTQKRIYKINTDGDVLTAINSIPSPSASGTNRGIVWENNSLWLIVSGLSPKGKIYQLDPTSGTVQDSITTPGTDPRGIVFVNGSLYCNDTNLDSVYVYDSVNKTWASVFPTPSLSGAYTKFATGMTWDGTNFWIENSSGVYDHIFKVSSTGVVLSYFSSPRPDQNAVLAGIVYTSR